MVQENFQAESAIKNLNDDSLNENFVGVFPADHMSRLIDFKFLISEKRGKYPFLIGNTDSPEKKGTHWWNILDIEPRIDLLF